jgi:hypothetical protein
MSDTILLTPTLHVEVQLSRSAAGTTEVHAATRKAVAEWLQSNYATAHVGRLDDFQDVENSGIIRSVHVADYTGPHEVTGYYSLAETKLDIQTYVLRSEQDTGERRSIKQDGSGDGTQARVIALPNVALNEDWDSLVFDDGLPSRLLRYLVRMVAMMGKPGLNLATFNWNKICLLHGPPGSGKSTLCRALAQKVDDLATRPDGAIKVANRDAAQYPLGRFAPQGNARRGQCECNAQQVLWRERETYREHIRPSRNHCARPLQTRCGGHRRGRDDCLISPACLKQWRMQRRTTRQYTARVSHFTISLT